jgi:hypothetical protein
MNSVHASAKIRSSAPLAAVFAAALAALTALPLAAQSGPSADEIMDKVFNAPRSKGTIETLTMVVTKNGQSLTRSITNWSAGDHTKGEVEKTISKFTAPADVKGSGFLTMKKPDGSTESLLWLPALGRVRRLGSGSSDQDMSFFGSDFTNRDINGFNQADFSYKILATEGAVYTVEATPNKSVGYEKLVYYIDSSIWRYVKIEYYRAGKIAKTQTDAYEKVGDYYMPTRIVMASATKSTTELSFADYKLDQDLGDQIFTERFLKQ